MRLAPILVLVLGLSGCATLKGHDAPGCSGPRRPANPQGSVLAPDVSLPAATPAPGPTGCSGGAR